MGDKWNLLHIGGNVNRLVILRSRLVVIMLYLNWTMDQLSAKARVEKEIVNVIIDGLNSGEMTVEAARQAARDTLATVNKIEEHEDSILEFYKNLSEKYPVFEILYTKVKSEIIRSREMSDWRRALTAIDTGDINGAHAIVKSAISQSANEATNAN